MDSSDLGDDTYWSIITHPTHHLAYGNWEVYGIEGWEGEGERTTVGANVTLSGRIYLTHRSDLMYIPDTIWLLGP